MRSANAAWLDLPKQLLAVQRHRGSKGVGPGESDQGHDEVAIGFIQLLAAVLKHAIRPRDHHRLAVRFALASRNRGDEARPVQVVRHGPNVEAWQEHLLRRFCRLLLCRLAACFGPILEGLQRLIECFAPWRVILVISHKSRSFRGWWLGVGQGACPGQRRLNTTSGLCARFCPCSRAQERLDRKSSA